MRSEKELSRKLGELHARRLKQFREAYLCQSPRNCVFNTRFRVKDQGQVGFCQNPVVLEGLRAKSYVCHESETAGQCKVFRCRNTEESVGQEFDAILSSPERCGEKFPKLAVLIWAVQEYTLRTRGGRFCQTWAGIWGELMRLITFRWW
jgi:hypothetical protein